MCRYTLEIRGGKEARGEKGSVSWDGEELVRGAFRATPSLASNMASVALAWWRFFFLNAAFASSSRNLGWTMKFGTF